MSAVDGSRAAPEHHPTAGFRTVARAVAWRSIHNFLYNKALLIGQPTAGRAVEFSDLPLNGGKVFAQQFEELFSVNGGGCAH